MQMASVDSSVGMPISAAPFDDRRSPAPSPSPTCRSMFSMTTVALSTRMPTASANPPSVMVLSVWPPTVHAPASPRRSKAGSMPG